MRTALLTAVLVAGATGLALAPIAHAEGTSVRPTGEAWFQPNPSCPTPVGCLTPGAVPGAPTAVSVYPSGTLHVAVSGGQETARTYLALPGALFTGAGSALLTVPVDPDPASGTVSPETAKVQACLATAPVVPVEGSFAEPPAVDCATTALAAYVATPQPHLEVDLGPLLDGLPRAAGVVLLPDGESTTPGDAWHVAFSSVRREGAATGPASVAVVAREAAPAPAAELPPLEAPAAPAADPVAAELGEAPLAAAEAPAVVDAAPEAPAPALPVQPVAFPQTVTVGYAYPGVWLLPLGLLVVVPLVGRTLTRDLAPVRREDDRD